MDCGRFSPGIALISSNPLLPTIIQFLKYLNDTVSSSQLATINLYIVIRSLWALPRIGCTYSQASGQYKDVLQGNSRIVDLLLSNILVLPSSPLQSRRITPPSRRRSGASRSRHLGSYSTAVRSSS